MESKPLSPDNIYFPRNNIDRLGNPSSQFPLDPATIFAIALEFLRAVITQRGLRAPSVFVCHAHGNPSHEAWVARVLARFLRDMGVHVLLDLTDCGPGADLNAFMDQIETTDRVIVVATPLLYQKALPDSTCTVPRELQRLSDRMRDDRKRGTVIPVLLTGEEKTSLPPLLSGLVYTNLTIPERVYPEFLDLLLQLYGLLNDRALQPCRWDLADACRIQNPPPAASRLVA